MKPVLELQKIHKEFPGIIANDHIDLTLNRGEVHTILGENGAKKRPVKQRLNTAQINH